MSSSSRLNTGVFALLAIVATGVFSATPAFAGVQYKYEKGLSEELTKTVPGGVFVEPFGLAFDSSGNLFVADPKGNAGEGIVDKFNDENVFQAPQLGVGALSGPYTRGVAVNDATGHIYVGDGNHSEVFALGAAGEKLSQWTGENTPTKTFGGGCCYLFTAVDNSPSVSKGDVYVTTRHEGSEIDVLEPQEGDKKEGKFVRRLEAPSGIGLPTESQGLAVDQANGEVYVADAGNKVVDRFSPTGEFEAAAQIKGTSGELFSEPVAVGVDSTTGDVFVIDHRTGGAGGGEVVDVFNASGGFVTQITQTGENEPLQKPVAVAVQESGPHAGDVYVSDAAKPAVDVFAVQLPEAPRVEGTGVQQLSGDSVTLFAEIDPRGAPTEYRLEYGLCSSSSTCASSPYEHRLPEPDASLGAEDFTTHTTGSFRIHGLSAQSTYHVRVIAHSTAGETVGEERTFTAQGPGGSLTLLDGRAWELVSPPDKHGAVLSAAGGKGVIEASAGGDAIAYLANAPTESAPEGNAGSVQVLSQRGTDGWSSRDIASPHAVATGSGARSAPEYRFFAEDLSAGILQPFGRFNPTVSSEASEQTPYLRTLGSCTTNCYRPLVSGKAGFANVPAGTSFGEEKSCEENNGAFVLAICGPQLQGASPDASHVVLRSAAPLIAGVPRNELYEWAGGQLKLVSVLARNEAGKELPAPSGPELEEQPLLGTAYGLPFGPSARRAVSDDGSRVFWESGATLYVRDTVKGETLQVDAPEAGCPQGSGEGECESGGAGRFEIASADGSRVLFTDKRRLTKDAGAGVGSPDLYECKIFTDAEGKLACELTDLTPKEGGERAFVQGAVLGASEDGGTVYFVADGVLAGTGASRGTCLGAIEKQPSAAHCNLYELHAGKAKLVAVLSGADAKDWQREIESQPTRVSPDGRYLSFMSERPLTGYDNRDAVSGQRDAEIYVYDSATETLACASCNPSGGRPVGVEYGQLEAGNSLALPATRGEWEVKGWVAALPPHTTAIGENEPNYQPRYLSDGGQLFFNALDALVPQDVNGTGDVYEYEPSGYVNGEGKQQCSQESAGFSVRSGGCIGLISSGTSSEVSTFLDASASGSDVFFLTASRLTPEDIDSREDVYDAHECTSASPCIAPVAVPPPCNTEASCKPAPTPPPAIFGAPPSATFNGLGNALAPALAGPAKAKAKPPTRAQKLAKALAACRKDKQKAKRQGCEKAARKKFGPVKKAKKGGK